MTGPRPHPGAAASFEAALALHHQGRLADAEAGYLEVLALEPRHVQAMHHAGIIALQVGRIPEATARFQLALSVSDLDPALRANLGLALAQSGRFTDALASLDRSLELDPRFTGALIAKGDILLDLARPAEALSLFQQALILVGDDLAALNSCGLALLDLHREREAVALFTRAIEQAPSAPIFLLNRALAYSGLGMPADVLRDCERSRALGHVTAQLWFVEGTALMDLGRQGDAIAAFDRALSLEPTMAKALNNRGSALASLDRHGLAVRSFDECLSLLAGQKATDLWQLALLNKCSSLRILGRRAETLAGLEALLHAAPDRNFARGLLLHERLAQFDWRDYNSSVEAILQAVGQGKPADQPLSFLAVADAPELQLTCARVFVSTTAAAAPARAATRRHRPGRLRVAYLSSDFRMHAVSVLMAGVLETHDRQLIEAFAVSTGADDGSELRRRIVEGSEHFLDFAAAQDSAIAARLAELDVQIAVDLNGHTTGARPGVLAQRPAPLQVSYLGFPGTTGWSFIDYVIADEVAVPPDRTHCFSEKVIYLPGCFQANDDRRVRPAACGRAAANLPEDAFVFCAFNSSHKINPAMFDVWCRLLRALPGSLLWVTAAGAGARANLVCEAATRGVSPDRLVFAEHRPYAEHLARIAHADLFLDTLPFNGGTTASDFLWMGVPVLTCAGKSFAGRMAASLLRAVDLPDLVTESLSDYEALALELARDRARLAQLRTKLAAHRSYAPLFNTRLMCRNLEAAYREIWNRYARGEAPETIRVCAPSARVR